MRILVTGKNGQLGRSIHKIINASVGNVDSSTNANQDANKEHQPHEFIFVGRDEIDLSKKESITTYFDSNDKFDIIINCAAYTAVDKAEEEQDLADQVNHLAVKQLAQIASKQKAKLIHISTDYVFNGESDKPYMEADATNPINVYGKTKLAGEKALQEFMPINAIIIRTSWVYSEYGNNFVKTILRLGKERVKLSVVSDQIGSPTYATDLAEAILKIINNRNYQDKEQTTEIYHYSNEGEISWFIFAKLILKLSRVECEVNAVSSKEWSNLANRPNYGALCVLSIEKKYAVLIRPWKESVSKCLNLLNN